MIESLDDVSGSDGGVSRGNDTVSLMLRVTDPEVVAERLRDEIDKQLEVLRQNVEGLRDRAGEEAAAA